MANPQTENGHVRIANELFEAIVKLKFRNTSTPHQLILAIIRKTYGFGKKTDKISLSQFCQMTGVDVKNVIYWLRQLIDQKVLLARLPVGNYGLNKDFDTWGTGKAATGKVAIRPYKAARGSTGKAARYNIQKQLIQKTIGGEDFEKFWKEYPKKKAKKDSMKAWTALSMQDRIAAMEALPKHKILPEWKKDRGAFIPLAASWLRGARWEDDLSIASQDILEGLPVYNS